MATLSITTAGTTVLSPRSATFGPTGERWVESTVFQVLNSAGGFSTLPRIRVDEATAATPANVQYFNVTTGATLTAGTAITADGIYAVYHPGCQLSLLTSAGTATVVTASRLLGRVF